MCIATLLESIVILLNVRYVLHVHVNLEICRIHSLCTYLSHSSSEEDVFKHLPTEILSSVIHATLFQQQL